MESVFGIGVMVAAAIGGYLSTFQTVTWLDEVLRRHHAELAADAMHDWRSWFVLLLVGFFFAFDGWRRSRKNKQGPPSGGGTSQKQSGAGQNVQVVGNVHGGIQFGGHKPTATLKISGPVKTRTPTVNPTGEAIYVQFPVNALGGAAEEAKGWLVGIRRFKAPDQWEQIYSESVRVYWSHTRADVMEAITINPGVPHNLNVLRVLSGPQQIELQVNAFAVPLALASGVFSSTDTYVFDMAVSAIGIETAATSLTFRLGANWDRPEVMVAGVVKPPTVLTLRQLFTADFSTILLKSAQDATITIDGVATPIVIQAYFDFDSRAKFVGYFVPNSVASYRICEALASASEANLRDIEALVTVSTGMAGQRDQTLHADLRFSGQVVIYHETHFTTRQAADLQDLYKEHNAALMLRGPEYQTLKAAMQHQS